MTEWSPKQYLLFRRPTHAAGRRPRGAGSRQSRQSRRNRQNGADGRGRGLRAGEQHRRPSAYISRSASARGGFVAGNGGKGGAPVSGNRVSGRRRGFADRAVRPHLFQRLPAMGAAGIDAYPRPDGAPDVRRCVGRANADERRRAVLPHHSGSDRGRKMGISLALNWRPTQPARRRNTSTYCPAARRALICGNANIITDCPTIGRLSNGFGVRGCVRTSPASTKPAVRRWRTSFWRAPPRRIR